jgi:hypothetical protein
VVPAPELDEGSEGPAAAAIRRARRCARLRGTGPGRLRQAGIGIAMGGRGGCRVESQRGLAAGVGGKLVTCCIGSNLASMDWASRQPPRNMDEGFIELIF